MKRLFLVGLCLCLFAVAAPAQAKRIVVIKADGLPQSLVERYVAENRLPNIRRIFYDGGAVVRNFYTRGISLSAPSWSLLDTGRHLQIKGNIEYDRFTARTYDYLNFLPFYVGYFRARRADKLGVEVLDNLGISLLADAFNDEERRQSFQLFQRGARWATLGNAAKNFFATRTVADIAAEWAGGLDFRGTMTDEYERELIEKLNDPRIRYLDCFTPEFDHTAHLHRDGASHLRALQNIDALVGRVWTAIESSSLAAETILVLVSDHGLNTDERVYSQGYNLVNLLSSAAGGAHHVVTDRLIGAAVTASGESFFLKGQSKTYPTALLDLDGNERASIHLRNSDLNALHALLLQLKRKELTGQARTETTAEFFSILERNRPRWTATLAELREELGALRRFITRGQSRQQSLQAAQPQNDLAARRRLAQLNQAKTDETAYTVYAQTLERLPALRPNNFNPAKLKIEELIAPRAMGEPNSIYDLQNYVAGVSPPRTVNYFALLTDLRVRNNVQAGVGAQPVDFVAVRVPQASIASALAPDEQPDQDAVWLYADEMHQALILACSEAGELRLRYLPVAELTQNRNGKIQFRRAAWQPNLPLKIWEDADLHATGKREEWLNRWHSESAWLRAIHETKYSNALIGLHEHLALHTPPKIEGSTDEQLLRRFRLRQRRLTEADLLVMASDHWNFNVRGFNAGGNHGSFFRASTHSVLMFAGSGIPRAARIEESYDSLSFVPTVRTLLGFANEQRNFPGRVIQELF
ncbi:MAG TPA: alkaline phosphatase family protein [Blastocatellia bacterium]|nr:alkaline phosphatase family protein [Blastocatellia bacterium]HMV85449.1 alkaline phosphatase family protein [Blastocatellia bacterium]HMY70803.1 alkaline phosphatase family protein [Blastocatellia bacterium]HMZ18057.1 alkaline phosphatase family protein [Blastocatellia bacterium]HNG30604.1 alkaline phosphatase family protein [Blastocatellia bacterium]